MNLTEYERKHKKIVLCRTCKGKARLYYTPVKLDSGPWVYDYLIIGIQCKHKTEGRSRDFHAFVKSILPYSQVSLQSF